MTMAATTGGATDDERIWRRAINWLLVLTLLRIGWLALGTTDLYPDEAQYWLWSLHPAFGYYSKPPLLAWLIALTTRLLDQTEPAIRLSAPLLHFAAALFVYQIARRLFDARTAFWSAIAYATLPGVFVSAAIISTDAPLMLAWASALYAFVRAREPGGERWWWAVGAAAGAGLLAKYAMAYWLISALLFLLACRDERRHLKRYVLATGLALLIYAPNFFWNLRHGFVSYRHTEENAVSHGAFINPGNFLEFFFSQFGVFGPLLFGTLLLIGIRARRNLADKDALLLGLFAFPTLLMMFVVSFISHAQPNWSAPAYISAVILVVAWLRRLGWQKVVTISVALHVAAAVLAAEARPIARAIGYDLPGKYDPLHRLRGWRTLGTAVSQLLAQHPGATLLSDDREDMAILLYYVKPHPFDALKWNGESGRINDQFDLEADPARHVGGDFLLVTHHPENTQRILDRFAGAGPIDHVIVPLGSGEARNYTVRLLTDFKGYR